MRKFTLLLSLFFGSILFAYGQGNVGIGVANPTSLLTMANTDSSADIRIGNRSFNKIYSGRLAFDEDVTNQFPTCGFEFLHNGAFNSLCLVAGCEMTNPADTIFVIRRGFDIRFQKQILIGASGNATAPLDVDGQIKMRQGAMAGYLPVSNGSGLMTWTDPATLIPAAQTLSISNNDISISGGNTISVSQIADTDDNTFVKTETAPNENIIRFSANGSEIATMTSAKFGIRNTAPIYTFDLKHPTGIPGPTGGNGLNIENEATNNRWTLYTYSGGLFSLWYNGFYKGAFDPTTGEYATVSDERLKRNITTLSAQMPNIMKLRPTNYQFIQQKDNTTHMGLIAQEVRKIYPELAPVLELTTDGAKRDMYGVTYSGFVPVLVAGLQEQQKQIDLMQQQIDLLKSQNEAILKRLDANENLQAKK